MLLWQSTILGNFQTIKYILKGGGFLSLFFGIRIKGQSRQSVNGLLKGLSFATDCP